MSAAPTHLYAYAGEGPGKGEPHVVVMERPGEIVTTSILTCRGDSPGHSWIGDPAEFRKQFKRIQ